MTQTLGITIKRPYIEPDLHITTDCISISSVIMALFKPYACISDSCENAMDMGLYLHDRGIKVTKDGITKLYPAEKAIQTLLNTVYETSRAASGYTLLHAAAVAYNNKAYILAADTGTGKSTLTAYLSNTGFTYLTDDKTIIENETLNILPYRKNIMLRSGGIDVLKENGINLNLLNPITWGGEVRHPYLPSCKPADDRYEIGGFYFLSRNECEKNTVENISSGNAFIRLLSSGLFYSKSSVKSHTILKELIKKGCYQMNFNDVEFVGTTLKKAGR